MKLPDIELVSAHLKDTDKKLIETVYDAIKVVVESEKKCKCTSCKCDKALTESAEIDVKKVKILSFFDSPSIKHQFTESENEIFVKSVDVMKDACGTGKIEILGRTVLMNVCESDNTIHANFDIEVDGKQYSNVPFVVKLTESENYLKLNKNIL